MKHKHENNPAVVLVRDVVAAYRAEKRIPVWATVELVTRQPDDRAADVTSAPDVPSGNSGPQPPPLSPSTILWPRREREVQNGLRHALADHRLDFNVTVISKRVAESLAEHLNRLARIDTVDTPDEDSLFHSLFRYEESDGDAETPLGSFLGRGFFDTERRGTVVTVKLGDALHKDHLNTVARWREMRSSSRLRDCRRAEQERGNEEATGSIRLLERFVRNAGGHEFTLKETSWPGIRNSHWNVVREYVGTSAEFFPRNAVQKWEEEGRAGIVETMWSGRDDENQWDGRDDHAPRRPPTPIFEYDGDRVYEKIITVRPDETPTTAASATSAMSVFGPRDLLAEVGQVLQHPIFHTTSDEQGRGAFDLLSKQFFNTEEEGDWRWKSTYWANNRGCKRDGFSASSRSYQGNPAAPSFGCATESDRLRAQEHHRLLVRKYLQLDLGGRGNPTRCVAVPAAAGSTACTSTTLEGVHGACGRGGSFLQYDRSVRLRNSCNFGQEAELEKDETDYRGANYLIWGDSLTEDDLGGLLRRCQPEHQGGNSGGAESDQDDLLVRAVGARYPAAVSCPFVRQWHYAFSPKVPPPEVDYEEFLGNRLSGASSSRALRVDDERTYVAVPALEQEVRGSRSGRAELASFVTARAGGEGFLTGAAPQPFRDQSPRQAPFLSPKQLLREDEASRTSSEKARAGSVESLIGRQRQGTAGRRPERQQHPAWSWDQRIVSVKGPIFQGRPGLGPTYVLTVTYTSASWWYYVDGASNGEGDKYKYKIVREPLVAEAQHRGGDPKVSRRPPSISFEYRFDYKHKFRDVLRTRPGGGSAQRGSDRGRGTSGSDRDETSGGYPKEAGRTTGVPASCVGSFSSSAPVEQKLPRLSGFQLHVVPGNRDYYNTEHGPFLEGGLPDMRIALERFGLTDGSQDTDGRFDGSWSSSWW
eukprot:g7362.t1